MKIIITENQLRNIILNEGDTQTEKGETLEIKLPPNSFPSGLYQPINERAIDDAIIKINEYISNYPKNSIITIVIESSESKVPNRGVGLKTGQLSQKRAEEVQKYLVGKLPKGVKFTIDNKGPQGPDWDYKKGYDHPDYTANQYVKLYLSVYGEREPLTTGGTVTEVCNYEDSKDGGLGDKNNEFISAKKTIDISKLNDGQKFKLVLYPRMVPDLLYVKVGDKQFNTGFIGNGDFDRYYSIMLATILHYMYGDNIPDKFPKNITPFDKQSALQFFEKDSGLQNILSHVVNINWSKNPSKNINQIEWYQFTKSPIIANVRDSTFKEFQGQSVGVVEFVKEPGMTTLEYSVHSPIGTTIWSLRGACL
jgi:hypothetical protein